MDNVTMAIQMRDWMVRRELLLLSQLLNRNLRYAVDFLRKKQYNITEQSLLPLRIVTTPFIDVPYTMLAYATVCREQLKLFEFKGTSAYTKHCKDGQDVIYLRGLTIPAMYFDMARILTHELTHVIQHHENRTKVNDYSTQRDYFENYMSNDCEKEALTNDYEVYKTLKGDKNKRSELSKFFGKIQLTQVLFRHIYMFEVTPNGVVSTWDDRLVPDDRHRQRNKSNEQRDTDKKVGC